MGRRVSGLTESRLALFVGWAAVVVALAAAHWAYAAFVGGLALIIYGIFVVDVDRPKREKKTKKPADKESRPQKTYITTPRR